MPNTTTPNMNLILPTIGLEPGPTYGVDQNSSFTLIDQHNHTPGLGVTIPAGGVNGGITIAGDLAFNSHNITGALINGSLNTITNIPSSAFASVFVKADGTQPLTNAWAAGAFSATFNSVIVGSAANRISGLSTIVNTGTLTLPISTDTLVGRATTDTLTNKSIDASTNTITNIVNANISGSAAIADTKLATPYIKADGTRALTSGWIAGNFTITANAFSATAGAGTIAMSGATNTITGMVGLVSTGATQGLTMAANGSVSILGTQTNSNAGAGQYGEYAETLVTTGTNFGATTQYFDATSLSLTAGDWLLTGILHTVLNGAVIGADGIRAAITTTSGNSGTGVSLGVNAVDVLPPTATANTTASVPSYRQTIASTTIFYLKGNTTYTAGPPQYKCRLSAVRIR